MQNRRGNSPASVKYEGRLSLRIGRKVSRPGRNYLGIGSVIAALIQCLPPGNTSASEVFPTETIHAAVDVEAEASSSPALDSLEIGGVKSSSDDTILVSPSTEPTQIAAATQAGTALSVAPIQAAASKGGIVYERLPRQEITLGLSAFYIDGFRRTGRSRLPLELSWHRFNGGPNVRSPFSYRIGLRSDFQSPNNLVPLELFARAEWTSALGYYQPTIGAELGLSAYTLFSLTPRGIPDSSYQSEAESMSPVYVSLCAAPARFAFKRWSVSVLEVHFGTLLPNLFQVGRLEVSLVNVGMGF